MRFIHSAALSRPMSRGDSPSVAHSKDKAVLVSCPLEYNQLCKQGALDFIKIFLPHILHSYVLYYKAEVYFYNSNCIRWCEAPK